MLTHHLYTLSKPVNPMCALMCGAVGGALPRLQRIGKDTNNFPPVQVRPGAFSRFVRIVCFVRGAGEAKPRLRRARSGLRDMGDEKVYLMAGSVTKSTVVENDAFPVAGLPLGHAGLDSSALGENSLFMSKICLMRAGPSNFASAH